MNNAQYANKSIVKYFSKHLDEFRREQIYVKEVILSSDLMQQNIPPQLCIVIPESMSKHINGS